MSIRRAFVVSITACLVCFGLATSSQAQSLADAAANAAAKKRAKVTQPGRVYTNADMPASSLRVPTAPTIATSDAAAATDGPGAPDIKAKPAEASKDEAYWRSRYMPLKQRINENHLKSLTLSQRIHGLTIELGGIGALNARRGGVETERQRLITVVSELDDAVRVDIAAVAAIEEEGRQAGAPPGWFRN